MKKVMAVVIGALLIALGVLFGLKELGVLQADISLDGWWTLFLIVPGAVGIFTSRDKIGNIIVTLIGVYLLLAARGVIGHGFFRRRRDQPFLPVRRRGSDRARKCGDQDQRVLPVWRNFGQTE